MEESTVSNSLMQFVPQVAAEIDALIVAGHQGARLFVRPLLQRTGLPHAGLLIDLRLLLRAHARTTVERAALIARYADRDEIRADLQDHVAEGILTRQEEVFNLTDAGRELIVDLTVAVDAGLDRLWGGQKETLFRAQEIAGEVLREGFRRLRPESYPAFMLHRESGGGNGEDLPAQLFSSLTALRYLRADAHVRAWKEEGLDPGTAVLVAALWEAGEPLPTERLVRDEVSSAEHLYACLKALRTDGWIVERDDAWHLTETGLSRRDAIEESTNRYNAPPYEVLSSEQQLSFLQSLRTLRGMPRPSQ